MNNIVLEIEKKALQYVESGLEHPDFVFVSSDVYADMRKELHDYAAHVTPAGKNVITIWTSSGHLHVTICPSWPAESIVVGNHPLLPILNKLGLTV